MYMPYGDNRRLLMRAIHESPLQGRQAFAGGRGGHCLKISMVYRLCNNMVYTFALGSPSNK